MCDTNAVALALREGPRRRWRRSSSTRCRRSTATIKLAMPTTGSLQRSKSHQLNRQRRSSARTRTHPSICHSAMRRQISPLLRLCGPVCLLQQPSPAVNLRRRALGSSGLCPCRSSAVLARPRSPSVFRASSTKPQPRPDQLPNALALQSPMPRHAAKPRSRPPAGTRICYKMSSAACFFTSMPPWATTEKQRAFRPVWRPLLARC